MNIFAFGFAMASGIVQQRMCVAHLRNLYSRKALRVIPRGKRWLTVYRALPVVRQLGCQKNVNFENKNEHISKSVNSIDFGAIFPTRLDRELSRNAGGVAAYAF